MKEKLLIISDEDSRIVRIKVYLRLLFPGPVDIHVLTASGNTTGSPEPDITESTFHNAASRQYKENRYALVVVDTEDEVLPANLQNWYSYISAPILYIPATIPPLQPLFLVIPTNYHLLDDKTTQRLQWLMGNSSIRLHFIYMADAGQAETSLMDLMKDSFTSQVAQHFETGTYSLLFSKEAGTIKTWPHYINEPDGPFILGITLSVTDNFRKQLPVLPVPQSPYIIFD